MAVILLPKPRRTVNFSFGRSAQTTLFDMTEWRHRLPSVIENAAVIEKLAPLRWGNLCCSMNGGQSEQANHGYRNHSWLYHGLWLHRRGHYHARQSQGFHRH